MKKRRRKHGRNRVLLASGITLLVVLSLTGGYLAWVQGWFNGFHFTQSTTTETTSSFAQVTQSSAATSGAATSYSGSDLSGWGNGWVETQQSNCVARAQSSDEALNNFGSYSNVTANVNAKPGLEMNAGYAYKLVGLDVFTKTLTFQMSVRLPVLPKPDTTDHVNPQVTALEIQAYDGQTKTNYVAQLYWELNPWISTYGDVFVRLPTGDVKVEHVAVDTSWHTFQLKIVEGSHNAPFGYYVSVTVDGRTDSLGTGYPLLTLSKPNWGTDTSAWVDENTVNAYASNCANYYQWTQQYKDWSWTIG